MPHGRRAECVRGGGGLAASTCRAGCEDAAVHVLIAPDRYDGALSAPEVGAALAAGWERAAPHDVLATVPLSDGGPGLLDALAATLDGTLHAVVTTDPLGREVPASVLVTEPGGPTEGPDAGRRTAYVEAAQACGLHLLGEAERDPGVASSHGVGPLVEAALELGVLRLVVGVGGAATNDAGAGLLAALGVGTAARLARGGSDLVSVTEADLDGLDAARERLRGVDLVVATDVDAPLLGLKGTSAVHAERRGAAPEQAQSLENALGHFAAVVARVRPPARDLLSGTRLRPEREPGAGAGGGLAFALRLLGGRLVPGVDVVAEAVGLERYLAAADLAVTGLGRFDWESLRGTVCAGVAGAASRHGVPAVVVAGEALVGRREAMAAGLSGVYAVAERPAEVQASRADPAGALSRRVERVARTWSPPPR
ncbi:glycerate kinase [Terracoccus luteus]|uniref:Glycerate kinase n=1 Tax=Terracoccus luteus TaxID=53356 RepID=A0A839PQ73_9MICO|nr:glycerate kinase [Terracoccus luteus]